MLRTAGAMLAERLTAQLLAGPPARSVGAVVGQLLAVQAQDLRAARLAIRSRSQGLAASDVDRALGSRELVITTVNRGTLHLIRSEDYPWLSALTTPQLATGNQTRLRQEGVSEAQAERGVAVIVRALQNGPKTRTQMKELLRSADVPTAGQAYAHTVFLATLRGLIVRGPMVDKEHGFVLVHDWLPTSPVVDRATALRELGRRYLLAHAAAQAGDLQKWAGITLGEARSALKGLVAPEVEPAPLPGPRLLGGFDEILMGWVDRQFVLGHHRGVVTMNGIFKPILLVDGQAAATWRLPSGKPVVDPFIPLSAQVQRMVDQDAIAVSQFLAG